MSNINTFRQNLTEGQKVELAVVDHLKELLPDCRIIHTPQDNDIDRYIYSLVDIVVVRDDRMILGIECKYGKERYNSCEVQNGWPGDYNTPLNRSSLRKYKDADFPVFVININKFCRRAFAADLDTILKSPNDAGKNVKRSGEVIYNVDSRSWMTYEGSFTLTDILKDIIGKVIC